jgi:flagellar hook-associated protein 1 FlgK
MLNSALHIGRSAIGSYQSALSVVGNNIANAADPDYARQLAIFDPIAVGALPEGLRPGGGVALTSLHRVINEALEGRLRAAIGAAEAATSQVQLLTEMESLFAELGDAGIRARLEDFFASLQDVQNLPSDTALRGVAVEHAAALAGLIRARFATVGGMIDGINREIEAAVLQADQLAREIADLNVQIVQAEAGGHVASALRNTRDARLRELAELMDITVREYDGGTVSVFVGGEALVQLGYTTGLATSTQLASGRPQVQVEFGDGSGQIAVTSGRIGGLLETRDNDLGGVLARLDRFASGMIAALNLAHAGGQGLEGFTTLTGTTALRAADLPLDQAAEGLPVVPRTGSLVISVSDQASGRLLESELFDVSLEGQAGDTTLAGLAAQINAGLAGLTATVTPAGGLALTADPGLSFSFGNDGSSGREDSAQVLAALGMNTLFTGRGAADIAVDPELSAAPQRLAVAGAGLPGDTANIARLLDVQTRALQDLDGRTLADFHDQFVVDLAAATAQARQDQAVSADLRASLQAQREAVSGVNLDEEAINLMKYERAFQGAARFTSVVDELISEMLDMMR